MTASNAANTLPATDQQTVFAYCQNEVLAAGRMKPAGSTKQWAQENLVAADQQYDNRSGQVQ